MQHTPGTSASKVIPVAIIIVLCRLRDTLVQILEALQPLQKLLELLNPRYESVLRHTFEQGRLSRLTPAAASTMASNAVGSVLGSAGGYLNAAGTAGRDAGQSLRSMPGLSKGLRRARDEHGGQRLTFFP